MSGGTRWPNFSAIKCAGRNTGDPEAPPLVPGLTLHGSTLAVSGSTWFHLYAGYFPNKKGPEPSRSWAFFVLNSEECLHKRQHQLHLVVVHFSHKPLQFFLKAHACVLLIDKICHYKLQWRAPDSSLRACSGRHIVGVAVPWREALPFWKKAFSTLLLKQLLA